jgi:hypothetical protein
LKKNWWYVKVLIMDKLVTLVVVYFDILMFIFIYDDIRMTICIWKQGSHGDCPVWRFKRREFFLHTGIEWGKSPARMWGWDGDHTLGQAPILKKFNKILFFCWLIDEMAKPLKTLTLKVEWSGFEPQSWHPTLAISAFQPVELGFVDQ